MAKIEAFTKIVVAYKKTGCIQYTALAQTVILKN